MAQGLIQNKFAIAFLGAVILLSPRKSMAVTYLKDVCGTQGSSSVSGTLQASQLCQSAYVNGNLWTINNNNSRVNASVAIVCAYSCMAGGITSCGGGSGGGGSACSMAVNTGYRAYDYSNMSDQNYADAQANGSDALVMKGGNAFGDSPAPRSAAASLPSSCASAASTGNVQDRIGCAVATDPALPPFVSTAQFQADFQAITGQNLQNVINQPGSTLLANYSMGALQNAYSQVGNQVSLSDFLKNGASIVTGILGKMGSTEDQNKFIAKVIPPGLRGWVSGTGGGAAAARPTALASVDDALSRANQLEREKIAEQANEAKTVKDSPPGGGLNPLERMPASDDPALSSWVEPENNPSVSIFARISAQYKRALALGSVSRESWANPVNRALNY